MRRKSHTNPPSLRWEHFPREAGLGVSGFGATPAQAFRQAALALVGAVTDPALTSEGTMEISREASELDLPLVDWLRSFMKCADGYRGDFCFVA